MSELIAGTVRRPMVYESLLNNPRPVPDFKIAVEHRFEGSGMRAPLGVPDFRNASEAYLKDQTSLPPPLAEDVGLAITELHTNGIIHSKGGVLAATLGYTGPVANPSRLVIKVEDSTLSDKRPLSADVEVMIEERDLMAELSDGERGLPLVQSLGFRLGYTATSPHTAIMWAEMDVREALSTTLK